ncbi:hypothetical protein TNCT_593951 [Trichonephila clavata]|uniref:Uncharacterized protein n=1 Tax=Trichonephila clavata TaxID=2740835 RepID=A0A8X6K2T0_TRICU|nr:hypothetical protein TNCT_593951 [Trichonephila clavata]
MYSSTIPSLGYWHHRFDTNCPKPVPCSRSLCSPINVMLTARYHRARKKCAKEHVNWRRNEKGNIRFSDFSVHPENRRMFIWLVSQESILRLCLKVSDLAEGE